MRVVSKILKNNRSVFSRVLFAVLLFVLLITLLGLYFGLMNLVHKDAHLSLSVSDIDAIHELQASSISADFVDNYYFDSTQWAFHGKLLFEPDVTEDLELLMSDGQWKQVQDVLLYSEDESVHKLRIPQLHLKERVDYAIHTGSIDDPKNKVLCKLTYINHTSEDYSYSLTAPAMFTEIYWESEENADREYLEVYVDDENTFFTVADDSGFDKSIISRGLRIPTINFNDKKVGGFWQVAPVKIIAQDYDDYINFSFSPLSEALSDAAGTTLLSAYYPSILDTSVTGTMSFRYALKEEDYKLRKERISFRIDDVMNEKVKSGVTSYGYISFSGDNEGAAIGLEELHYPMLVINTEIDTSNKKRISSFDLDTQVTAASLGDISLFPNIKTFFTENWRTTAILSAIISFGSLIIPKQQEPGKKKKSNSASAELVSDDKEVINSETGNSESSLGGKSEQNAVDTTLANNLLHNKTETIANDTTQLLQPIFDVKILSVDKQVPGTADVINFWGNTPFPKHKNVQLQVELCNDVIIRNLKIFGRTVDTLAKKNKPYQITACYQESPDVKWPSQVNILTRDIYPAGSNGIPTVVQIEYNLDNDIFIQLFRLNEEQLYMPQSIELAKQKDYAKIVQVKNRMMEDFLKPASEIKQYTPVELWEHPEHKFVSGEVIIISKDCQDPKWNTDGGFGKYEIYDFCDEGLLLWDVMTTSVEVDYYQQSELQTAIANRLLCLPFETVITYDLRGNSSYNMPIIYADFQISDYKYYYLNKATLMLLDNAMIVNVKTNKEI